MLGESDAAVLAEPGARGNLVASLRESLRQGGGAWDNVAWVGPWDIDLQDVRCPVTLWYGEADTMAPRSYGEWLAEHLSDAELVVRRGEGHLGFVSHWSEVLAALTA